MHAGIRSKSATSQFSFKLRLENVVHRLLKPSLRGNVKAPDAYLKLSTFGPPFAFDVLNIIITFKASMCPKRSKMHTFMGNKEKEKATNTPFRFHDMT